MSKNGTSNGLSVPTAAAGRRRAAARLACLVTLLPRENLHLRSRGSVSDRPPDEVRKSNRDHLRADCSRCAALCCVAPAFAASADFGLNKPAGRPCPKLRDDFGCGIHDRLREQGFPGCDVFDCFGAGQQVVQVTFGHQDWREDARVAASMFDTFTVMRQLHELLWYLTESQTLLPPGALRDEVDRVHADVERLTRLGADELAGADGPALRQATGDLLARVSETARQGTPRRSLDRKGADLIEAKLRGADLRGTSLRGSYLLGADLRGADLRKADLLGADLRAADLTGANLSESIFLTQPQVQAARGDATTALPPALTRPRHWPTTASTPATSTRRSRRRRPQ